MRVHPTKTAGLLKTHNFTGIVYKTLQFFYEKHNEELVQPLPEDEEGLENTYEGRGAVTSSGRTFKQRSREGTEVLFSPDVIKPAAGAMGTVFLALCAAVGQLEALIKDKDHVTQPTAEHLKSALRSPLERTARTLGMSLYLTNSVLHDPKRSLWREQQATSESEKPLRNTAYRYCVLSMVELWTSRSFAGQTVTNYDGNVRYA